MTLPRKRRLTSSSKINKIFREGKFYRSNYCHLVCGPRVDISFPTRAAFIVSTKTAGKAVDRNRIKRLMKESFRLKLEEIVEGRQLVFIATRKSSARLKRQDFDNNIDKLLVEADLLAENN